ncbi:uncharacterized protein J3R85_006525 [Psidium guajava]|nr:uncharacterized protein J3R85_006525 [Psidium guajava]
MKNSLYKLTWKRRPNKLGDSNAAIPESNREAARTTMGSVCRFLLLIVGCAVVIAAVIGSVVLRHFLLRTFLASEGWPMVHVASLSLSLPSTPLPPAIVGNWSVALSVENPMRGQTFSWDHARVVLLHGSSERVAETSLERFSVAPGGNATLETGTVAFSLEAGERAAWAMAMDSKDGVMELAVALLPPHEGLNRWFDCDGLKVGFSSQNQSQVGSLLNGSPHKCERAFRVPDFGIVRF